MKNLLVCAALIAVQWSALAQIEPGISDQLKTPVANCDDVSKNAIRLLALDNVQNTDSINLILDEWSKACIMSEEYLRTAILFGLKEHRNIDQYLLDYEKYWLSGSNYNYRYKDEVYSKILKDYTAELADSLAPCLQPQSRDRLWCLYFGSDQHKYYIESTNEYYEGHPLHSRSNIQSGRSYNNIQGPKFNPGVGVCIPTGAISKTIGINTSARIGLDLYDYDQHRGAELRFGAKIIGNQSGVTSEIVDSIRGSIDAIYSVGLNGYKDFSLGNKIVFRTGMMVGVDVLATNFKVENDTTDLKITTAALTPSIGMWSNRPNKSNIGIEISYAPSLFFLNNKLNNDLRGGFFEVVIRFRFQVLENYW